MITLETISKNLEKKVGEFEICGKSEIDQTAKLLTSSKIMGKVLEYMLPVGFTEAQRLYSLKDC